MALPTKVKVAEVGPRDGLQNEPQTVATATKVELINRLSACGLPYIEATSFVSAHKIPQLADGAEVMAEIIRRPGVTYAALAPNIHGLENAIAAKVEEVGFFTTVSETFCHKNINCSIAESLDRLRLMLPLAQKHNIRIRGYISCVLGCPYEGDVSFHAVANMANLLYELGCYEISLGDTIGIGTADKVQQLLATVLPNVPLQHLAVHFHDTYGQALTNIYAALEMGIRIVDSSVAGLGGCPYAKGASGNVATEDVVYLLNGLGIKTGIDLQQLAETGEWITQQLQHPGRSKAGLALTARD